MKYVLTILFVVELFGCSFIIGDVSDINASITVFEAESIVENYLITHNVPWGKYYFMRYTSKNYVFKFETPEGELGLLGERVMFVDYSTGKVSFPPRM